MMKVKHLRKMVLAVALAAAFPQAALACRWYDVPCQVREEEQRLEREAEQAFERAREESERLLREAEQAARRINLPGIENDAIQAIWHSAESAESFLEGLVNYVKAAATNEHGLLLSDVSDMVKNVSLDEVLPKEIRDHIQTAEVPGSPLNQHIHKLAARHRRVILRDGTVVPVRPPVVSEDTSLANSTTASAQAVSKSQPLSNGVGVGEIGNKYAFGIIPSVNLLLYTSLLCSGEGLDPCPDLSMSVGFPLLTVSQPVHHMNVIENRAVVFTPQAEKFPVKLSFGLVRNFNMPLPLSKSLKDELDVKTGGAIKFNTNMTCLTHPAGQCRIDTFSVKFQLKAGMDTLLAASKAYNSAEQAFSYVVSIAPTLGWNIETTLASYFQSLYPDLAAIVFGAARSLRVPQSVQAIGTQAMEGVEVTAEGDGSLINDVVSSRVQTLEEVPNTVESVLSRVIEAQIPAEAAEEVSTALGEGLEPLTEGGRTVAQLIEDYEFAIGNASEEMAIGNAQPAFDVLGEVSKFCEKVSYKNFSKGDFNPSCSIETRFDLQFGFSWRNSYATLPDDDWKTGYDFHGSPDVGRIALTVKEIAQVELAAVNMFAVKGRLGLVFTESFWYQPFTTLGARATDHGNEDDFDLD